MAEPTLSLTFVEIRRMVGHMIGFGRDVDGWDEDQTEIVDEIIATGLQQFYFPPPLREGEMAHDWSFLKPVATLVTVADQDTYDLPDSFGFMEEDMTYSTSDNGRDRIRVIGEAQLRRLKQDGPSQTGQPRYAAYRPKSGTGGSSGQRYELLLYPTPNAVYNLTYRYAVLANALTTAAPYPYGGMTHGRCIMQSCKAAAELHLDDQAGPHTAQFMMMLRAAVSQDLKRAPEFLGVNGDCSDERNDRFRRNFTVTYNGVDYP